MQSNDTTVEVSKKRKREEESDIHASWWKEEGMDTKQYVSHAVKFMRERKEKVAEQMKIWAEYHNCTTQDLFTERARLMTLTAENHTRLVSVRINIRRLEAVEVVESAKDLLELILVEQREEYARLEKISSKLNNELRELDTLAREVSLYDPSKWFNTDEGLA